MKQRIPPQPLRVPDPPDTNAPGDGLVAHVYRPSVRNHRSERGIVVLPIQGGDYEVSTLFADFFSDRGYNVLRFERRAEWLEAEQDPEVLGQLIPAFRQNIVDGVELWREQVELKSGIGLFGVSMGAITGTVVAADLPDLEACVLVMGGGNLADILCTARDEVINEYRRDLSKRLGVTEGDLLPRIRAAIKGWDPLEHASKIETRRVFFVNTLFDPVVRPRFQALLWEALGRPERMRLPCGHYSAVIFVPVIKRAALKWMDRWLPGGDP